MVCVDEKQTAWVSANAASSGTNTNGNKIYPRENYVCKRCNKRGTTFCTSRHHHRQHHASLTLILPSFVMAIHRGRIVGGRRWLVVVRGSASW
jgi:hypothetical protein